jgi:hypothetical protein
MLACENRHMTHEEVPKFKPGKRKEAYLSRSLFSPLHRNLLVGVVEERNVAALSKDTLSTHKKEGDITQEHVVYTSCRNDGKRRRQLPDALSH